MSNVNNNFREWIGVASMLYVIDQLLNNPKYASLLDKFNYYIIPVQNVDGYIHTHEKDRMVCFFQHVIHFS